MRPDEFSAIRLKVAGPHTILSWSHGEVLKPETINYRTQKPERDGLFSEVIFGPEKDYQCACGKYKKARYKGVICDKCGVEVTKSIVRRERMGHITLATPVAHIWFFKKLPSKMSTFFDLPVRQLERVIYFASYIVISVDEEARAKALREIKKEFKEALKKNRISMPLEKLSEEKLKKYKRFLLAKKEAESMVKDLKPKQILSEVEYRKIAGKFPGIFEVGMGAEALRKICEREDLEKLREQLRRKKKEASAPQLKKILERLKLVEGFIKSGTRPEWMFITVLPVIPPDLRPMVQLDGGRFASSDVNDLYRRVINRNNRLKKLKQLNAPEVIMRNEKRMLQEAVDALLDNSARRGKAVTASQLQQRPLKSLADMLRGKQGRFRRNLLGKRVDYSGRSVIVSGPNLKLDECGLPKKMALEIFRPFVISGLIKKGLAHNVRGAGRVIEEGSNEVWDILEEATKKHLVLLNRAPTLHRLSIQAFKPVLIEGNAIQLHPLVCAAFNADFDGDQMAIHLPLSEEAQEESSQIMLSKMNLLKPATGRPITNLSQDMVLGIYYLTSVQPGQEGPKKYFSDFEEALLSLDSGFVSLREKIYVRIPKEKGKYEFLETTPGRIIFNQTLPPEMPFINETLKSGDIKKLTSEVIEKYDFEQVQEFLDKIKKLGFDYATYSGITWSLSDMPIPPEKKKIISEAEQKLATIQADFDEGLLSDQERKDQIIELWHRVKDKLAGYVRLAVKESHSIYPIIESGARGSWGQIIQMLGMKGLVVNPAGEEIEFPVRDSFKEGFNVLEYFISTHGARKGTTDTALRTAASGYLTRRLIDVAHDVIVEEEDCGTQEGIFISRQDSQEIGQNFAERLFGRVVIGDIRDKDGSLIIKSGQAIDRNIAQMIDAEASIEKVKVRSPISCETDTGICRKCYGYDLGRNKMVELGLAAGIVAAQSIGEPGTQLTLRTFHMGGVAGSSDITQGLPRVEEIFEVRKPKVRGLICEVDGKVADIKRKRDVNIIKIKPSSASGNDKEFIAYSVPAGIVLWVRKGDLVHKGQQISEGNLDLRELYRISGAEAVQNYIIKEVAKIYSSRGADINQKHIEVIIRKLFSRVKVVSSGDTDLLPGKIVEKSRFVKENQRIVQEKGEPAKGAPLLLGITKVASTTDSWLSAASFQETAQALIEASCEGKIDTLRGLKENVIIGRLIPAGTGFKITHKKVEELKWSKAQEESKAE